MRSLPAYITLSSNGANNSYTYDYPLIDNPANPSGPDMHSGLDTRYDGSAGWVNLFRFTFGANPVRNLRLGVFLNGVGASADTLRVAPVQGNTVEHDTSNHQGNDYFFFDLLGLRAGDVIDIWAINGTDNRGLSGFTFDALQIPEPASAALFLAGALALALARRRR